MFKANLGSLGRDVCFIIGLGMASTLDIFHVGG
jgi:hypothetical protein